MQDRRTSLTVLYARKFVFEIGKNIPYIFKKKVNTHPDERAAFVVNKRDTVLLTKAMHLTTSICKYGQ